jgi:hypothetical protein
VNIHLQGKGDYSREALARIFRRGKAMVKGKDDYAAVAEELGSRIVALQECNRVLWGGLAMILDRHGFLPKENFAKFLMSVAGQANTHPDPEVGKACSALVAMIAKDVTDPEPKARWRPEIIGGFWKDGEE